MSMARVLIFLFVYLAVTVVGNEFETSLTPSFPRAKDVRIRSLFCKSCMIIVGVMNDVASEDSHRKKQVIEDQCNGQFGLSSPAGMTLKKRKRVGEIVIMSTENLAADSILDTPVTWAELEEHLRSALKTEAKFASSRGVVNIGDGAGFASICALITCDWVGAAKDEQLPKRVILKIPSMLPMRRMSEALPKEERLFDSETAWAYLEQQVSKAHNIEIASYQFFHQFSTLTVPKMFYSFRSEKESEYNGQICIEFMENTSMMSFTEAHSLEQIKQVARALGKLQSSSLNKEATSPEFAIDMFGDFAAVMPKEVFCSAFKPLLQFDSSPRMVKAVAEIEKILPVYYGANLPSTIHKQLNYRPVLVNGDLRTENVLVDKDTGDLAALIDWQCTHHGVAVEDLLRIQMFGQSAKERRDSAKELLDELYNSMLEGLDGAAAPYTLEELHELYDLLLPHCGLYAAFAMPNIMKTNLAKPGISEEEKAKMLDVQLDKILGILEDVVAHDASNKNSNRKIEFRIV